MDLKILTDAYNKSSPESKIILDRETYYNLSNETKNKLSRDVSFVSMGEESMVIISKTIKLHGKYLDEIKKEKPDKIIKCNYINILDFI